MKQLDREHIMTIKHEDLAATLFESDRLWQYFEYHAKQRIETFKFYVLLSSVIITGAVTLISRFQIGFVRPNACLELNPYAHIYLIASLLLGAILIIFSIAFWMLDNRNNLMIDISRNEIINLEESSKNIIKHKIFKIVNDFTELASPIRFHHCFWIIFLTFIIIGMGISIYSFQELLCWPRQ
jgi:hypothetical protein